MIGISWKSALSVSSHSYSLGTFKTLQHAIKLPTLPHENFSDSMNEEKLPIDDGFYCIRVWESWNLCEQIFKSKLSFNASVSLSCSTFQSIFVERWFYGNPNWIL